MSVDQSGYVYLIQPTGFNVYKVGMSIDPHRRVRELQSGRAAPLSIVASIFYNNATLAETMWHGRFNHHKLGGEWFALPDEAVSEFCYHASLTTDQTSEGGNCV